MNLFSFFSSSSSCKTQLTESTKQEFHNRNVLITGASSGLGRSIALLLSTQCQCHIIILSARSLSTLQVVQQECYDAIRDASTTTTTTSSTSTSSSSSSSCTTASLTPSPQRVQIHIVTADLSQTESVQLLAQKTMEICQSSSVTTTNESSSSSSSKTLDILINNGGVSSRSSFVETDIMIDQQMMQINFFAGAILAKAMIQHHHQQQQQHQQHLSSTTTNTKSPYYCGRIIWISSVQGKLGIPNRSSYAASKFAVQGYCECIRAELYNHIPYRIYVHTVSPGYIRTNLSKSAMTGTPGIVYGKMDPTTEQGMDPYMVAIQIMNAVAKNQLDIIVAVGMTTTIALYLKFFFPKILQSIMVRRYQKSVTVIKDKAE